MNLSVIDNSLLLAAFFRGNTRDQDRWTSSSDQVLTLSLFYTGEISSDECRSRFSNHGYIGGLYDARGNLNEQIKARYVHLVKLILERPQHIEGGGNFESPADPTFTSCRLTETGLELIPDIIGLFPPKPDFPNWPDRRPFPMPNVV